MESFSKTGCLSVRAAYYAKMTCGLSPGPAVYDSKTAMGRQISSTKKSAGQVSFGSARRDIKYGANKTPAADKYTQLGSFGKQPTDKQRTAPAFGFGTDLQRPKPVPFVMAMRTGVVDPDSGQNVAVPATHGSMEVKLSLPDFSLGTVQFYQGLEGFTGWHPDGGWDAPWCAGASQHGDPLTEDELVRAADIGTAFAVASVSHPHPILRII